ncbi:MAG: MarR family transcriptional regulator [Dehalococcoidia bacterium]
MAPPSPEPAELARRLNSAFVHMGRALRDRAPEPLAAEHQLALAAVVYSGSIAIGALAKREGVTAPAMTKTVGVLEQLALVRRMRDPGDGRVVLVQATLAGKRTVMRGRDARVARFLEAFARLAPADYRGLAASIGALEALVAGLGGRRRDQGAQDR